MASNFVKTAPSIKKSLQSGVSFNQGFSPKSNVKDNAAFLFNTFTSNIGTSNIVYPINGNFQTDSVSDFNFSSNQMIPSGEFNVIKVDLDTNDCSADIKLNVRYGHNQALGLSEIKYSTIIAPNTQFFRNYPIENEYFSISLQGTDELVDFNSVKGRVTLSQFTQYNAPVQIEDSINRFKMSTLEREGNDFDNDVIVGRVGDVRKRERLAIMPSDYGKSKNILWGVEEYNEFDFGAAAAALVVRSSSPNDSGKRISISGINELNKEIKETITLAGTSNAFTFEEYKFVGFMEMIDGANDGDIICEANLTGIPYNYMANNFGNSSSLLYTVPDETAAIIKDVKVNGTLELINSPDISIRSINFSSNTSRMIYYNNQGDGLVDDARVLDIKLNAGDCVIGQIEGGNGNSDTANLGVSSLSAQMNIIEYSTATNRIGFNFS